MQLPQRSLELALNPKSAERKPFTAPCEVIATSRDICKDPRPLTPARRRVLRTPRGQTMTSGQTRVTCETAITLLTLPHGFRRSTSSSAKRSSTPRTNSIWNRPLTSGRSKDSSGFDSDRESINRTSAIFPGDNKYHTTWDGHVVSAREYEVLLNKWHSQGLQWVACSDGQMCSRAIQSGKTRNGEPVYIARALSPVMTSCLGIFRPSTGVCYIPWRGREVPSSTYELLCNPANKPLRASMTTLSPSTILSPVGLKILSLRNPVRPLTVSSFRV